MSKKPGAGQLARIGLFMAIGQLFGIEALERKVAWRKEQQSRGVGHALGRRIGGFGSSRAGFKLVKKMARRSSNRGWVKLYLLPIHAGENRGHSAAYIGKWAGAKPGPVPLADRPALPVS